MMSADHPASPATQKLLDIYEKKAAEGIPFKAYTLPLYSTAALVFEYAAGTATSNGFAVCPEGTEVNFFHYGMSSNISTGLAAPNNTRTATEYDTNLTEASKTPSNMDFAIEMVTVSALPPRIAFTGIPGVSDTRVLDAFRGFTPLNDVAGLWAPSQLYSPFNLEHLFDQVLRQAVTLSLHWGDNRSNDPLGMLDGMHDGRARSYLRAAGIPEHTNGLYQPEGHLWFGTKPGSDSKLTMKMRVQRNIVIPVSPVLWPGGEVITAPSRIVVDYRVNLHGLGCVPLGSNS